MERMFKGRWEDETVGWDQESCCGLKAAIQCGPALLAVKPSSLLIVKSEELRQIRPCTDRLSVSVKLLYEDHGQTVSLLCFPELLDLHLRREENRSFLENRGYGSRWERALDVLAGRYGDYRRGLGEFPHEMGVMLGYPLGDVLGFMRHHGQNFLCCGWWKVYENEAAARRLFALYDRAKNRLVSEMILNRFDLYQAVRQCTKSRAV